MAGCLPVLLLFRQMLYMGVHGVGYGVMLVRSGNVASNITFHEMP